MIVSKHTRSTEVIGDLDFPTEWTVFTDPNTVTPASTVKQETEHARKRTAAALQGKDPVLAPEVLTAIPECLNVSGQFWPARRVKPINNQFDFRPLLGAPPFAPPSLQAPDYTTWGRVAYIFIPLHAERNVQVTLGVGADSWLKVWLNGEVVFDHTDRDMKQPPSIDDYRVPCRLKRGTNILAARYVSGKGSSVVAIGGPRELRTGHFDSILLDPILSEDPAWVSPNLRVAPGDKPVVDIGSRRELFVDDFLIERMTGAAERRLHQPMPREVVLQLDRSWEGPICTFFTVLQEAERIRIYYSGRPGFDGENRCTKTEQAACMAESEDGIHFTRPELRLYPLDGAELNNRVWRRGVSGHNFSPFRDANPAAPPDQQYKAIAYHPDGGGLCAYASPDGIHWRMLSENRVITSGGFDSQNLAFWDHQRNCYVDYHRGGNPARTTEVRAIMTCTSEDFIHWTEPQCIEYTDDRLEHMYTNGILPYPRAPHIYLGTPARFVPQRRKVSDHPVSGVSDAVLMSSRDGRLFERWAEAFIPPGPEKEVWTDRNNFPAWGMAQTAPEEISFYWTEHYRQPTMCLRRGTIRTDGFVSLHAGGGVGEMLTRPLTFSGTCLEVNYRTSAAGLVRFELCQLDGTPIEGFALADSEVLFGNEISHTVRWKGTIDLSSLIGRAVRVRVRLQDADVYSMRFTNRTKLVRRRAAVCQANLPDGR